VTQCLFSMLDLDSFVLEDSLRMAPQYQNKQEFDTFHELYFINLLAPEFDI
jgi:hypothetical protein